MCMVLVSLYNYCVGYLNMELVIISPRLGLNMEFVFILLELNINR